MGHFLYLKFVKCSDLGMIVKATSSKCRRFQYSNIKKAVSDRDLRLPIFRGDTKQDLLKDSAAKRSKFYSEGILAKFIL